MFLPPIKLFGVFKAFISPISFDFPKIIIIDFGIVSIINQKAIEKLRENSHGLSEENTSLKKEIKQFKNLIDKLRVLARE